MSQTLVLDIGNSNISVGIFRNSQLAWRARIASDSFRTVDEYQIITEQLLKRNEFVEESQFKVIVASVVPILTSTFDQLIMNLFKVRALQVGPGLCAGIPLNIPNPASIGADRIANTVAAGAFYSKPALVVDFGTATTFDVVGSDGAYEGGIIAPGPETALAALLQKTAKLTRVDLVWPNSVLGKSSEAAMQSGLVIGYMELIDGLIDRLRAERGEPGKIIATGGLGNLFAEHSRHMSIYDPDLALHGLNRIAEFSDVV